MVYQVLQVWNPIKSLQFIVNPNSKGGRTGKVWNTWKERIESYLASDFEISYATADGIGEGVDRAKEAIEVGVSQLISVGGEGTNNEVLNGIVQSNSDTKLGFIRAGTANDYLTMFQWPSEIDHQLEIIKKQEFRPTPIVEVRGENQSKVGLNVADIGIGATIAHMASVQRRLTWLPASIRYPLLSLRAIIGWKNIPATVEIDNEVIQGDLSLLTSGFSKYSGGYHLHPHAEPFGEKMAYTLAMDFGKLEMMGKMNMLKKGEHTSEMDNIWMGSATKIVIQSENDLLFEVDGEPFEDKSDWVEFSVYPEKVDVMQW